MTKITLYRDGKPQEYTNAHDITTSPAGVLSFHWEISEGGPSRSQKRTSSKLPCPLSWRRTVLAVSAIPSSFFLTPSAISLAATP
jgi:hypothetical protein